MIEIASEKEPTWHKSLEHHDWQLEGTRQTNCINLQYNCNIGNTQDPYKWSLTTPDHYKWPQLKQCGAQTGLSGRSSCSRWIYRNTIQQEWSSGFRITGSVECPVGQLVTLPWSVDWDSSLDSAQIHPQIIHVVRRNSKCSAALWAEVRDFLPPWLHLSFHLFHNLWSAFRRKCNFRPCK